MNTNRFDRIIVSGEVYFLTVFDQRQAVLVEAMAIVINRLAVAVIV